MAYVSAAPRTRSPLETGWIAELLDAARQRRERNRIYSETLAELASMSDRELEDVGLSRLMIRDVARDAARRAPV